MDGLVVYRADGTVSFDLNYSLARIIDAVLIGSPSGSIEVPQWANSRHWFFAAGVQSRYYRVTGTTLAWQLIPDGPGAVDKLYYGIW